MQQLQPFRPTGRHVGLKEEIQWQMKKSEWKNTEIWKAKGKRRWTPTRAVSQDTRANPNSPETLLVRKFVDIGHQRAMYGPKEIKCKWHEVAH